MVGNHFRLENFTQVSEQGEIVAEKFWRTEGRDEGGFVSKAQVGELRLVGHWFPKKATRAERQGGREPYPSESRAASGARLGMDALNDAVRKSGAEDGGSETSKQSV